MFCFTGSLPIRSFSFLALIFACVGSQAQERSHPFFEKAKSISYRIHYGFIEAGTMECTSDTNSYLIENRKCHKLAITGKTGGAAAAFAKINDRWVTYIDTASGYPFRFIRELQENGYSKEELTEFDRKNTLAIVSNKTDKDEYSVSSHKIPEDAHDMVSAYLRLHSFPFQKQKTNDTISMNIFLEDSTFAFKIKYLGKERIKTKYGKKNAFKISPIMPENSIFSKEEAILCWLSADTHRIPLKLRAKLIVGAVEMELEKYSGYEE